MNDDLEHLLELAHRTVTWADQCYEGIQKTAGGKHYWPKRQAYLRARIDYYAPRRPLNGSDTGGCTCGAARLHDKVISPDCLYHYGAGLQPDNHRFPWNCPTYYDGCNCACKALGHADWRGGDCRICHPWEEEDDDE